MTLVLAGTLVTATIAQGGYYRSGQLPIAVGLVIVLATCVGVPVAPRAVDLRPVALAAAALAVWAIVRGVATGDVVAGLDRSLVVASIMTVVAACRRITNDDRATLEAAGLMVGVGIALTGWVGVAAHVPSWSVGGSSTWRAASTLTYPNAAAAILVAISLLATARRTVDPRSISLAVATTICLAGVMATQSRAGALGLIAGAVVLAATLGVRRTAGAVVAPALGAAVAALALLPGIGTHDSAHPMVAALGMVAGTSIAAADAGSASRAPTARRRLMSAAAATTIGMVIVGAASGVLSRVGDRISVVSSDRAATNRAAIEVIADRPLTGVGPGQLTLLWDTPSGVWGTRLVHNEYLQLVAELGIVGGVLLVALLGTGAHAVMAARRRSCDAKWAGGAAALAALLVHSAFDFLWHIPVIVLLGAGLVGLTTRAGSDTASTRTTTEGGHHHETTT